MDPKKLRRAVKGEINKLAASCFQVIANKLIGLLPEDGCPTRLAIFLELIIQGASTNETLPQEVFADLIQVLKYNYLPPQADHRCGSCQSSVPQPAVANGRICGVGEPPQNIPLIPFTQLGSLFEETEAAAAVQGKHSFSSILTAIVRADLASYCSNLSDPTTLTQTVYDEEDQGTKLRQRRNRMIALLMFVAELYMRNVLVVGELEQIFGLFIIKGCGDDDRSTTSANPESPASTGSNALTATNVELDDTHLEGLLRALTIMGHRLEQNTLGREWISSIINTSPPNFQDALNGARSRNWLPCANASQKLITALRHSQAVESENANSEIHLIGHHVYMGDNLDYPDYISRQELEWLKRTRAEKYLAYVNNIEPTKITKAASFDSPRNPKNPISETTGRCVTFSDQISSAWVFDYEDTPDRVKDDCGEMWRQEATKYRRALNDSTSVIVSRRRRPSQINSTPCNIGRSESFCEDDDASQQSFCDSGAT